MQRPEPLSSRPRFARFWPWVAPALLLGQLGVLGVTAYLAVADPTFAIEPDYYRKALDWDATAAKRRALAELGWRLQMDVSSLESPLHERAVRLLLHDRDGRPIAEAEVDGEAFHHARAGDRRAIRFQPEGGAYCTTLPVRRAGLWEFRLRIQVGEQTVESTQLLDVAPASGVRP